MSAKEQNRQFMVMIWLLLVCLTVSGSTNDVFRTQEQVFSNPAMSDEDRSKLEAEKVMAEQNSVESKPSAQDPGGNWGLDNGGLQLSLRFDKSAFEVGEAIWARIILRNVGNGPIQIRESAPQTDYTLAIANAKDEVPLYTAYGVGLFELAHPVRPSTVLELPEMYQRKFQIQLDKIYDMSVPGEYVVYASRKIKSSAGESPTEIRSGNAIIRIVAKNSHGGSKTNTQTVPAWATELQKSQAKSKTREAVVPQSSSNGAGQKKDAVSVKAQEISLRTSDLAKLDTSGGVTQARAVTPIHDVLYGWLLLVLVSIIGWILYRAKLRQRRN